MNATDPHVVAAQLSTIGGQLVATKSMAIGLYAVMIYDHLLTLPGEIEHIWKRRFSVVTLLFIVNRYYALLAFAVTVSAFFSPLFTHEVCPQFAVFLPFAVGVVLIITPGIVMGLRIYALYGRNKILGAFIVMYLLAEFVLKCWINVFPGHHPLVLPPSAPHIEAFQICIELASDSLGNLKTASYQLMETIYDLVIFGLMIAKTISAYKSRSTHGALRTDIVFLIARHGVLYFAAIFTANLLWAMLILFAPKGLKYSTVTPSLILVCTLVNRLTIDLRQSSAAQMSSTIPVGIQNSKRQPSHGAVVYSRGPDIDFATVVSSETSEEDVELRDMGLSDPGFGSFDFASTRVSQA
ncbi:hypothetical protein BD410DRAFT_789021 [Rickenella mellea]|uniref:DUF6533 domain-containing protein n=1 Tax=Rickenella mellea TaxID=50990 RepID=A0A4Y7Q448_9AGAM|nr:hypothetical protein BD410DRAFT_789021 [Rickenella mellea]